MSVVVVVVVVVVAAAVEYDEYAAEYAAEQAAEPMVPNVVVQLEVLVVDSSTIPVPLDSIYPHVICWSLPCASRTSQQL